MRGVRSQLTELITGLGSQDLAPMSLGLSHSLSRHKLKFSADKVDTMIIQAIGLIDDLDKELNTYAMRVHEWHFPELAKIVQDNVHYAKAVKLMSYRTNLIFPSAGLHDQQILAEEVEAELKEAAVVSMRTGPRFDQHQRPMRSQVLSLSEYRSQLYDYLKSRMNSIAPNLTALGLENLALKTKHATPKYGLIYYASLIGRAAPKHKGKVSRSLASKTAWAIRCDALGETKIILWALKIVSSLKRELVRSAGLTKGKPRSNSTTRIRKQETYNAAADSVLGRIEADADDDEEMAPRVEQSEGKRDKKKKKEVVDEEVKVSENVAADEDVGKKKKKKKHVADEAAEAQNDETIEAREKKKKRKHAKADEPETETPSKKKDKKKKTKG
ncbi:probable nucleolar protein 5-2 [Tanacetum coccineum]